MSTDTDRPPVCQCPEWKQRPWINASSAECGNCGNGLADADRDRYRRAGVLRMPWLGFDEHAGTADRYPY